MFACVGLLSVWQQQKNIGCVCVCAQKMWAFVYLFATDGVCMWLCTCHVGLQTNSAAANYSDRKISLSLCSHRYTLLLLSLFSFPSVTLSVSPTFLIFILCFTFPPAVPSPVAIQHLRLYFAIPPSVPLFFCPFLWPVKLKQLSTPHGWNPSFFFSPPPHLLHALSVCGTSSPSSFLAWLLPDISPPFSLSFFFFLSLSFS